MSTIQFLCPQGHPLTAHASQAGREAKCPTCGTLMQVPAPATAGSAPQSAAAETPPGAGAPAAAKAELFFFYCPEGHKLNGPVSLAGRPGKCPHCGSRFVIPSPELDEPEEETQDSTPENEAAEAPIPAELVPDEPPPADPFPEVTGSVPSGHDVLSGTVGDTGMDDTVYGDEEIPVGEVVEEDDRETVEANTVVASRRPTLISDGDAPTNWASFFRWAWEHRSDEDALEILLKDGERLRPARFAPELSQQEYAVLAIEEDDEHHIVMAVRWADMQRILLRGVGQLPESFR